MASSSKQISMPLVFAISVGSVFAMVAITVFGMAWYAYEDRKITNQRVEAAPMHDENFEAVYGDHPDSEQVQNLNRTGSETIQVKGGMPETRTYTPIDQAMEQVIAQYAGDAPAHHHEDGHDHGDEDHGHDH